MIKNPSMRNRGDAYLIGNLRSATAEEKKYQLREIMNAIKYIVKTGCQWRMLPKDFPPHNTVF